MSGLTLAIVGAGFGGVAAVKSALECGLKPTAFETRASIGGVWDAKEGLAWPSMKTNISRYNCMFSDFPWPKDSPLFPTTEEVNKYLLSYVQHFQLARHIEVNTKVVSVKKITDGDWIVSVKRSENETVENLHFNRVVVASGVFIESIKCSLKDEELFGGRITRSSTFRSEQKFKDKNVVVIGCAFTGSEIAARVSEVAKSVVSISRSNIWFLKRLQKDKPVDFDFFKHNFSKDVTTKYLSPTKAEEYRARNEKLEKMCSYQQKIDGLRIDGAEFDEAPKTSICDEFVEHVVDGKVKFVHDEAVGFTETGVVTKSGKCFQADDVILATGFKTDLSFLDTHILNSISYSPEDLLQPALLYKCTFAPGYNDLGFIGLYRGPFIGAVEMQARWVCMVLSGELSLPDSTAMEEGMKTELLIRSTRPRPQFPHGDYPELMASLAAEMGVLPSKDFSPMEDSTPVFPSIFRLTGPHANYTVAQQVCEEVFELMKQE